MVPMQLRAEAEHDGNRLQHDCHIALTVYQDQGTVLKSDEWFAVGYCYGQILDVMNTLGMWHTSNGMSKRTTNGEGCIPDGVTIHQATLIVMKYLDDHPEKLNLSGTGLIMFALRDAYPCKE